MSNQISLTIPNDDPIALRAFGNALEEMAVAHGAESRKSDTPSDETLCEFFNQVADATDIPRSRLQPPFTDDDDDETVDTDTQRATSDTIDADGLPWDARIHSGNQERNSDNTWRVRRRPKDLTPEQWAEQLAQVRDELFALMAIPVADPVVDDEQPEPPAAVFGAPEPVEVPPAPLPPVADPVPPAPAPLPPVVAADTVPPAPAPLPTATTGVPATLAELMTWLTSKAPADDAGRAARLAQINDIVARHGLVALGQLQKRLDLIPQVYADLVKELGQ